MKRFATILSIFLSTGLAMADEHRIVSLDGPTTETLFALGVGDWVVACDDGSIYPQATEALPKIGAGHQINVEGILALRPTLVVGKDRPMSGPAMHLLESAKAKLVRLNGDPGVEPAKERIRRLGDLVNKKDTAEDLIANMESDLATLEAQLAAREDAQPPKVLVLYLRPGVAMLMGEDSSAAAMLSIAGASNAIPGLEGYREMNAEAVIAAQPDVVLTYAEGLESVGGPEGLWKRPGLAQTPAGRNQRLVVMDDLKLAGFGPRTGEAALELANALWENAPQANKQAAAE